MFAWAAQMLASFPVPCLGNEKRCSLVRRPHQTEGLSYLRLGRIIYNLLLPKTSFNICSVETAGSDRSSGRWHRGAREPTRAANSFKYTALNSQKCGWRRHGPNSVPIPRICADSPRHCRMSVSTVTFSKSQLWVQAQKAYYYENLPPKFISHSLSDWGLYPAPFESHFGCSNLN